MSRQEDGASGEDARLFKFCADTPFGGYFPVVGLRIWRSRREQEAGGIRQWCLHYRALR